MCSTVPVTVVMVMQNDTADTAEKGIEQEFWEQQPPQLRSEVVRALTDFNET